MTYNAGDRKSVRSAEKASRLSERERMDFTRQMMSTTQGRSWASSFLVRCHIFATSFTPDALATAYAEGERNIGLLVLNDIMQACPDQYILMMRESNERHLAANSASSRTADSGLDTDSDTSLAPAAEHPGGQEPGRLVEGREYDPFDVER